MDHLGDFDAAGRTYPLYLMQMGEPDPGRKKVMIAAGIHGDEPAGVEAAIRFMEINSGNADLLSRFHFTIFPCNNPSGYELNTRENADGIDLNRQFAARKPAPEVKIITEALQGKCFDLVFEMHEDIDAPGLYLYEIADDPSMHVGEKILESVAAAGYPVNVNPIIEGLPAKGGLIRRNRIRFRKTRLPQAIYTYRTCGGHVITLEPPVAVLPIEDRVKIELLALDLALSVT